VKSGARAADALAPLDTTRGIDMANRSALGKDDESATRHTGEILKRLARLEKLFNAGLIELQEIRGDLCERSMDPEEKFVRELLRKDGFVVDEVSLRNQHG